MKNLFNKLKNIRKPVNNQVEKRINLEKEMFLRNAQEQLRELAKRGLSIPVFTL